MFNFSYIFFFIMKQTWDTLIYQRIKKISRIIFCFIRDSKQNKNLLKNKYKNRILVRDKKNIFKSYFYI